MLSPLIEVITLHRMSGAVAAAAVVSVIRKSGKKLTTASKQLKFPQAAQIRSSARMTIVSTGFYQLQIKEIKPRSIPSRRGLRIYVLCVRQMVQALQAIAVRAWLRRQVMRVSRIAAELPTHQSAALRLQIHSKERICVMQIRRLLTCI